MENRNTVKGIFRNSFSKPVEGVIVNVIIGSHEFDSIPSVSNEKGEFYVSDIVIPGTYTLEMVYNEKKFTREINVQSDDSIITINFNG